MSAFFDTNILVYAQQADGKGDRARQLFASGGKLSVQVLNEFTSVSRRKQRRDWREIDEAVADVLTTVDPPLAITLDLHISARALAEDLERTRAADASAGVRRRCPAWALVRDRVR